jgi:dihydrodipicolinate synthase/N-acetylneuraminate lyase
VLEQSLHEFLLKGAVIPAHPLATGAKRKLDERRQRALSRYYLAAGAGGLAVGVHTTQFAIHDSKVGLYEPVLSIAAEEMDRVTDRPIIRVAGLVGQTEQAVREATLARDLGYHAGLLSLAAMKGAHEDALLAHCSTVADVIPLFGFYLQPAVGGVDLPYTFWRRFAEIENVVAIKVAAFDRYRTLDVVRAIAESGRTDIALYTGNDDHIVLDLVTPFRFTVNGESVERRFVGGLLGHWAVWTRSAARLLEDCHSAAERGSVRIELLVRANEVTDANAALFDAANNYAGCIAGIHEVLRRQGLLAGVWCLDPNERLSPGQADEVTRVCQAYPHLTDDAFVAEHLDQWLR